jgi:acyl-CoA synthetase (AMP-forming)/AMP-acid ligase II/tetratricopeptide (TPR) repeat protein/thioesterase domain-containing protein/HEAT repeat protein/16S rRNA G966 N2-methylase RsmD
MRITSPLAYFGNRGDNLDDIFKLITSYKKKYRGFYDLFSGSASLSLAAMELELADFYVINDAFYPLTIFWEVVAHHADELIESYEGLVKNFRESLNADEFYKKNQELFNLKKQFNSLSAAEKIIQSARFAFIINNAEGGMPILKNNQANEQELNCQLSSKKENLSINDGFRNKVKHVNELFKNNQVEFTATHFMQFKEKASQNAISEDDIVLLDPPYPDMEDAKENKDRHIYYRTEEKSDLSRYLKEFLTHMRDEKNAAFLTFYGIQGSDNQYALDWPDGHMLRLSGELNNRHYGEYVENLYVSSCFARPIFAPRIIRQDVELKKICSQIDTEEIAPLIKRAIETNAHWNKPFPALFEKIVKEYSLQPALTIYKNGKPELITYEKLNEQINQFAHGFLEQGVKKGKLVAILTNDFALFVKCLFAVLKTGAAYIPIIPDEKNEVIENVIASSRPDFYICDSDLDAKINTIFEVAGYEYQQISLEALQNIQNFENPDTTLTILPDDLAYVMYTSGSTGKPKGAANTHRGIPYCIKAHQDTMGLKSEDVIAGMGRIMFDASLAEIAIAFGTGAHLISIPPSIREDIQKFQEILKSCTTAIFVPSRLKSLSSNDFPKLKKLIITGETYTESLIEQWLYLPDGGMRVIVEGYGLTETTICATLGRYLKGEPSIGVAIPGTEIHLLEVPNDEENNWEYLSLKAIHPNDTETVGQIFISGACLANSYYRDVLQTEQSFVSIKHPQTNKIIRAYKSGDLAVYSGSNEKSLIVRGRLGNQLKLRGQRLEPGQIEYHIRRFQYKGSRVIKDAYVVGGKKDDSMHLVAWLVPQIGQEFFELPSFNLIRGYLKNLLPDFMVPTAMAWRTEDELPLNKNGKVDRAALCKKEIPFIKLQEATPPKTNSEKELAKIWSKIIGIPAENIGREDDFFCLGGDSIKVGALLTYMREAREQFRYVQKLMPNDIYRYSTLEQMAKRAHYRILAPLRQGSIKSHSFILIHSILGDGWTEYNNFHEKLTPIFDQIPLYAARSPNLDDIEFDILSIEGIANDYLQEIKSEFALSNQTLLIGGWSSGGTIAFEMYRQLKETGIKAHLFLFDTLSPKYMASRPIDQKVQEILKLANHIRKKVLDTDLVCCDDINTNQEISEIIEEVFAVLYSLCANKSMHKTVLLVKQLCILEYQFGSQMQLGRKYFSDDVTLFLSQVTKKEYTDAEKLGWGDTFPSLRVLEIAATHFDIMMNPILIEKLDGYITDLFLQHRLQQLSEFLRKKYIKPIKIKRHGADADWELTLDSYIPVNIIENPETNKLPEECEENFLSDNSGMISQVAIANISKNISKPPSINLATPKTVAYADFFVSQNTPYPPRKIVLEGPPGSGKTLLTMHLLQLWAANKLWADQFDFVLRIELKTLSNYKKLITLLFGESPEFHVDEEIMRAIRQKITRVLFILDGGDEAEKYLETNQILKEILTFPNILVTTRPNYRKLTTYDRKLLNIGFDQLNLEKLPVTTAKFKIKTSPLDEKKSMKAYLEMFFKSEPKKGKSLKQLLATNNAALALIATPINFELIASVWKVGSENYIHHPERLNLSILYNQVFEHLIRKRLWLSNETNPSTLDKYFNKYFKKQAIIECLEITAFMALKDGVKGIIPAKYWYDGLTIISERFATQAIEEIKKNKVLQRKKKSKTIEKINHIKTTWITKLYKSGFINLIATEENSNLGDCEFFHRSFLHFFSARYVVRSITSDEELNEPNEEVFKEIFESIQKIKYYSETEYFLIFVAGLLALQYENNKSHEELISLNKYFSILQESPRDLSGYGDVEVFLCCLEAAQYSSAITDRDKLLQYIATFITGMVKQGNFDKLFTLLKKSPGYLVIEEDTLFNILIENLKIGNQDICNNTIQFIEKIWDENPEIIKRIHRLMKDLPLIARESIAKFLKEFDHGRFYYSVSENPYGFLTSQLSNLNSEKNHTIDNVLIELEDGIKNNKITESWIKKLEKFKIYDPPRVRNILIKVLASLNTTWSQRQASIYALHSLNLVNETILDILLQKLSDEHIFVKRAILYVLGKLKLSTYQIINAIANRLEDNDVFVKLRAIQALSALEIRESNIINQLKNFINNENEMVREVAKDALIALGFYQIDCLDIFLQDIENDVPSVKVNIERAKQFKVVIPEILDFLLRCIENTTLGTNEKKSALQALSSLDINPDQNILSRMLMHFFEEKTNEIKASIMKTLLRCAPQKEPIIDVLLETLTTHKDDKKLVNSLLPIVKLIELSAKQIQVLLTFRSFFNVDSKEIKDEIDDLLVEQITKNPVVIFGHVFKEDREIARSLIIKAPVYSLMEIVHAKPEIFDSEILNYFISLLLKKNIPVSVENDVLSVYKGGKTWMFSAEKFAPAWKIMFKAIILEWFFFNSPFYKMVQYAIASKEYFLAEIPLNCIKQTPFFYGMFLAYQGYINLLQKNFKGAHALYDSAFETDNSCYLALCFKGYLLLDEKSNDAALECFEEALKIRGETAYINNCLGNCYSAMALYEKANSYFFSSIEQNENDPDVYVSIANAYLNKGEYTASLDYCNVAMEKDTKNISAIWTHSLALLMQGRYRSAIEWLMNYKNECDHQAMFYFMQGYVYLFLEQYQKADKLFQQALKIDLKDTNTVTTYGILHVLHGDLKQVKQYIDTLEFSDLHEAYTKAIIKILRGVVCCVENRDPEAKTYFNDALSLIPSEKKMLTQELILLHSICMAKFKKYDKALDCFNDLIDCYPQWVPALYHKGKTLLKMDQFEEAILCFQQALEFDKENYDVQQSLAIAKNLHRTTLEMTNEKESNNRILLTF